MHALSFNRNGPKEFILAVDGAFAAFDLENDQVWSVNLEGTHACPFCLQTTYGLRARSMCLFPEITIEHKPYNDPNIFHTQPEVTQYFPDSLRVETRPIDSIHVRVDIFLPESGVLVGSNCIKNTGNTPIHLTSALAAILVPMGKGNPTRPKRDGGIQIIVGQTGDLWPVLFMTGGPAGTNNPYPALSSHLHLKPGQSHKQTWVLATKHSQSASLNAAREIIATNWMRVSQAHVMKHAAQTIQFHTNQPLWDAAFSLSQTTVMTHLISECSQTERPFILRTRLPDRPPNHTDKRASLDDLTTLELTHLTQALLPTQTKCLAELFENILSRCDETGFLPSKLSSSAFVQPYREPPLLANLCLCLYEQGQDQTLLTRVFPDLCRITRSWLTPDTDHEEIKSFTWENAQQLQMESGLFNFDTWEETGNGLALQFAESPALLSMLYRESKALSKIAEILGQDSQQKEFSDRANFLQERLGRTWQAQWKRFAYLDRESNLIPENEIYIQGQVQGTLKVKQSFKVPQRLQLHLFSADEHTRVCIIKVKGKNPQGKRISEEYRARDIHWALRRAHLTTQHLFAEVDTLSIKGLKAEDQFLIQTADFTEGDITCLLPIWSGAANKKQVKSMVKAHLNPDKARLTFGIPETWETAHDLPEGLPIRVNVIWNTLIIEGLLREGFVEEAGAIFSKLMGTIVNGLRDFSGLYPFYDSKTGKPTGNRNAIAGLVPMGLFLKIAGIHVFSTTKVAILNHNPFPEKIKIRWQGLHIQREGIHTTISFPDGSTYEGDPDTPILVSTQGA